MSPSSDISAAAAVLERSFESVRAVMGGEENRFSRALAALQQLAEKEGIPIAVVGGLGAIHYGYPAATQDIDIAVARNDLDRLTRAAPRFGFKIPWEAETDLLTFGDMEINVVPEGGKARKTAPTQIPGPVQLGVPQGLGYAKLGGWMEVKLSSSRHKDRAHIVEVLKKTKPDVIAAVRQHVANVHQSYADLFDELLALALEEKEQEGERGTFPPWERPS